MASVESKITISTLTYSVIKISFSVVPITGEELTNLDNYAIAAVTSGASTVAPVSVFGYDTTEGTTDFVYLKITRPTLESIYRIDIANLTDSSENELINVRGLFKGKSSKSDSMYNAFSKTYNTKTDSTLGQLIMAIGIEDDKIGGVENEAPIPTDAEAGILSDSTSTFGTATFGTNTFGG